MRIAMCRLLVVLLALLPPLTRGDDLRNRLGVAHVDGKYFFTHDDYLNEGADQILKSESRVIKVYLVPKRYPWNSDWPNDLKSAVEIAQTRQFRTLFHKPFETYILTVYSVGRDDHYWTRGITPDQQADETRQFHALTRHLLTTYRGSGKTFVLQHWEGDWALRNIDNHTYDPKFTPPQSSIDGMIAWLNARQAGIVQARNEVRDSDVHVYGATEANRVMDAIAGKPSVALSVLPHTTIDLLSYSSWDSQNDATTLGQAVDFLGSHLPPTAVFGQNTHSVYIGEFGAPENGLGRDRVRQNIDNVVSVLKSRELPWAIYWEIYCNELAKGAPAPPVNGRNDAVLGYWMIKPDGSHGEAWDRFQQIFKR